LDTTSSASTPLQLRFLSAFLRSVSILIQRSSLSKPLYSILFYSISVLIKYKQQQQQASQAEPSLQAVRREGSAEGRGLSEVWKPLILKEASSKLVFP